MILVTGGTGLVGAHLLLSLIEKGEKVRAIYRSQHKIDQVKLFFGTSGHGQLFGKISWAKADINDVPSLREAFCDVTHVYHAAAFISFDPNDYFRLKKANIEGTANIVNLCLDHGIEKLCYVSSIATLGDKEDGNTITEETPWNPDMDHNTYALSKYGAEMEVWRATQEGLDVVIVNPGLILGSGFYDSGSGKMIAEVAKGFKYRLDGVTGYVDVRDVATCMVELMNSAIKNERFILVSENWSFSMFCDEMAAQMNVTRPRIVLRPWMLSLAWRLDWLRWSFFRGERSLSKQNARSALAKSYYSNDKVRARLDHEFISVKAAISDIADNLKKGSERYISSS